MKRALMACAVFVRKYVSMCRQKCINVLSCDDARPLCNSSCI